MKRAHLHLFGFALGLALLAGQANAAVLANPGLAYTYTYGSNLSGPAASAGFGAVAENASPSVLNDGFFTTQAEIDADGGATTAGYYLNGGGPLGGIIFGTGAGNNRSITVDLGSMQNLGPVDMYYVAHGADAVDVPWQVDVIIDGGAPISFNPFDISATERISAQGRTGDARMSTIDLTGQSGQIVVLDFYSDGRTDLAGGGSQSCCGGEWTGLNEIVFVPEPATATMALLGLGGLFVRRRRRH